jgi:Cu(I)/Ag(I) efflux system protein CusF
MKKLILTAALAMLATPAFAKEYIIKEISDPAGNKPYYFSPDKLTIQPGDTVTFLNAQEDMHDVMFINVPKGVDEMIMSPMHKKEGDKFSYTFTVPGTYQFHCHPHEALGMKGTLIVGQASKPGETKAMDHDKMAKIHDDAMKAGEAVSANTSGLPQATGKINSVDAEKHTINVTHDPIKALGWPKMKMEFSVDSSVDLTNIKSGDAVSFTLKPQGNDDYVVIKLQKN